MRFGITNERFGFGKQPPGIKSDNPHLGVGRGDDRGQNLVFKAQRRGEDRAAKGCDAQDPARQRQGREFRVELDRKFGPECLS